MVYSSINKLKILFDHEFYKRDRFEAIRIAESLGYEITKIFKLPVDVTVLNSSSIAFAHAVVIEGIFVYEADRGQRILYEIILGNQFEELHPFIKELQKSKMESLSQGLSDDK